MTQKEYVDQHVIQKKGYGGSQPKRRLSNAETSIWEALFVCIDDVAMSDCRYDVVFLSKNGGSLNERVCARLVEQDPHHGLRTKMMSY